MINAGTDAWTDERIAATVTTHFVFTHLGEAAYQPASGLEETSDPTYAQRIATKARRLFLTLIDIGLPQQIFRLIDEFYDDDYLPFAEDEVASLRIPRNGTSTLDDLFYRHQFKYLVRVVREGEHIRYGKPEYVPLQQIEQKIANNASNGSEKVKLPSPIDKVLVRRQFRMKDHEAEIDILSEIAAVKPLSHQHVLSVYGSYTQHEHMYVLLAPAARYSLKAFLSDVPKAFELMPKLERRKCLSTWPHCLSTALAWIHLQGAHHGAVLPSRVILDERFQVSLGHFEGDDWLLAAPSPKDDLENYQYTAPEFWKRALTIQSHGTSSSVLSSGGRSGAGRIQYPRRVDGSERGSNDGPIDKSETARSNSVESSYAFIPASKGNPSRLQLRMANELPNGLIPIRSTESRRTDRMNAGFGSSPPDRSLSSRLDAFSKRSSTSSELARKTDTNSSKFTYAMPIETKKAMVQSWKSAAHDMRAADVFGLAAVCMDILTVLCSRSVSSFAKHRASKNRQAGRGGGLADASFHANLAQVVSWAETLHKDAEKKMKKDSGTVFQIVGPFLQEILPCFDKEAKKRPRADHLSEKLQRHLADSAGSSGLHCTMKTPMNATGTNDKSKQRVESRLQILNVHQAREVGGAATSDSAISTYERHRRYPDQNPRDHYEQSRIMTTSSLAYSFSSAHGGESELHNQAPRNFREEEPLSPEAFDYYEDQWTIPQNVAVLPSMTAHGRLHKDFTQNAVRLHRDFTHDDNDTRPTSPSWPLGPSRATHHTEPTHKTSPTSKTCRTYPKSDHKPPDTALPPIPSAANISQRRVVREPAVSHQADVDNATRMLAQTLRGLGQR